MVPFYFTHTKETQDFALEQSGKENIDFAAFSRAMFNAGIQATYGIKMLNNIPVIEKAE